MARVVARHPIREGRIRPRLDFVGSGSGNVRVAELRYERVDRGSARLASRGLHICLYFEKDFRRHCAHELACGLPLKVRNVEVHSVTHRLPKRLELGVTFERERAQRQRESRAFNAVGFAAQCF